VGKRFFDFCVCTCVLVCLLPLLFLIAAMVRTFLGSPVFFVQTRVGEDGRLFKIIKFRTMKSAFDKEGKPLPDTERLGRFGKFLRKTSLDELPELWNVIRGDMSIVGPRPLLPEYLPLYNKRQSRRHEVRPGITGWAQINGRNTLCWEDRFEMDVWYVDNRSLLLDLKIMFLTLWTVFSQSGVSADNHVTMPAFRGSDSRLIDTSQEPKR
jgi:lipopolysaccharide/colanic/teichoic acid biosynthesis glycosyltransferase